MTKESNSFKNIKIVILVLLLSGAAVWPASAIDTGIITGTVTDSYTGAVIPGATVTVGSITTTTDNSGSYTVEVASGTYTITAGANGYNTGSINIAVATGTTVPGNLALTPVSAPPGKITGTVTDAVSRAAIPGASVTAGGITATTDFSGTYTIELAAGTYTVTAIAGGYNSSSTDVTVTPGATATAYFTLTPVTSSIGKITGTVTDSYSGAAISGATVTAGGITAITDSSGSYTIEAAAGTYTVTASADGYNSGSTDVTVTPGTTAFGNLALTPVSAPLGKITGTVTDANSRAAIPGATVTAGSVTATTDYAGNYIIETDAGTYTVTASATGYNTSSTSVTVTPGATATAYLPLTPALTTETPTAPTLGVPSETPTATGTGESPGFGIFEAIAVLVLLLVVTRKRKV
ncbi:carboxypeptidase regulatory-like domain-containing protein [Methanosarcina sp.]|uniref:carboxypeptidase regulatory-like domain-containing protein n=1 Tax=Methanosarcina sp. TaxID=2213 RepID=UPI003C72AC72